MYTLNIHFAVNNDTKNLYQIHISYELLSYEDSHFSKVITIFLWRIIWWRSLTRIIRFAGYTDDWVNTYSRYVVVLN